MTNSQPIDEEQHRHAHPVLPEPPRRNPDEYGVNWRHLTVNGNAHFLSRHFGHPETTLLSANWYIVPAPTAEYIVPELVADLQGCFAPDLLIAFDVDPEAYHQSNGYIVSEQGKSPDFVLEIASCSTGRLDLGEKRDAYAALGIPEYWRFDETGCHHGTKLAGDRLEDDVYQPITVEELPGDILRGYSRVLHLDLRWCGNQLQWYDPDTERHITTFDDELARYQRAKARADEAEAHTAALNALTEERKAHTRTLVKLGDELKAHAETLAALEEERKARTAVEARIQELAVLLEHRRS